MTFRTKKCFSHQIEPYIAIISFSAVLKHLYRNWQNYHLCQKSVFLNKIRPHTATKLFCYFEAFFLEIDKKTWVFLIKMSKMQLNEACLLYWSIFTEIDKKLPFMSKKYFSHQIDPHRATLSFSAVLKYFYRNWQKTCHLGQKSVFHIKVCHMELY